MAGDRARLVAAYDADPAGPIFLSEAVKNLGQHLSEWTVKDVFDHLRDVLPHPPAHTCDGDEVDPYSGGRNH
jgi:hypothetical protein